MITFKSDAKGLNFFTIFNVVLFTHYFFNKDKGLIISDI